MIGCEECEKGTTSFVNCPQITRNVSCSFAVVSNNSTQCVSLYSEDDNNLLEQCEMFENGLCVLCNETSFPTHKTSHSQLGCFPCGENCALCNTTTCLVCFQNFVFSSDRTHCETTQKTTSFRLCGKGMFLHNGECDECDEKCDVCDENKCIVCEDGFVLDEGVCVEETNCRKTKPNVCRSCENGFHLDGTGRCKTNKEGCFVETTTKCQSSTKDLVLRITTSQERFCEIGGNESMCEIQSRTGCLRCEEGKYESKGACPTCSTTCKQCGEKRERCTECSFGMFLSEGSCVGVGTNLVGCFAFVSGSSQCAICNDGFFLKEGKCIECNKECGTCRGSSEQCVLCSEDHFVDQETFLCTPRNTLSNCTETTTEGCWECEEGFFLNEKKKCKECKEECTTCVSKTKCTGCEEEYVLVEGVCVFVENITHCTKAENSFCVECEEGFIPTTSKTGCVEKTKKNNTTTIIVVVVIVVFFVVFVVVLVVFFLQKKERRENNTLQDEQKQHFICSIGENKPCCEQESC